MAGGQDSTRGTCRRLLEGHKANHVPVVATRDSDRVGKGGSTCAPNKSRRLLVMPGRHPLVAPLMAVLGGVHKRQLSRLLLP